ncbi:DUF4062 domain-containing protein [Pseudoflavonifractor phocaeensis]|uniref:DUF4062 domain-containing protein n=1 Tax=Pseudoflavonifractor phocaeensis TaxID=1870988 RepID=UPI0025A3F6F3|nr:DUF4062 domain-containing protein [Pseudoflavonifractor phocaeensis]MDM8239337.1 DUF4062 domain-containing protein [Pseudoflavonifractor phocaeensis]
MRNGVYKPVRIFIATPGDLMPERNAFLDVINEVNNIKAHRSGFHIEGLGWEQTLPGKGRPQALINSEIEKCDLFIMLLWERWGTPTGEYSSGTEEEFYVAKNLNEQENRPEMWLFFKESDNADSRITSFRQKQCEQSQSFFYHTFESTTRWKDMLRQFLCQWLDKLEDTVSNNPCASNTTTSEQFNIFYRVSYQDWVGSDLQVDPIIYFTIEDSSSLEIWKRLSIEEKKCYIYDRLSDYLGLTLGANPYLAQLRYKRSDSQYILLATISRKYQDSLEQSRVFIPPDYTHLCAKSVAEVPFEGYT